MCPLVESSGNKLYRQASKQTKLQTKASVEVPTWNLCEAMVLNHQLNPIFIHVILVLCPLMNLLYYNKSNIPYIDAKLFFFILCFENN